MKFGSICALWRARRTLLSRLFWKVRQHILRSRVESFSAIAQLVADRHGLEIGGPSAVFARSGFLPLYPLVGSLDNCNFCKHTVWQGTIQEGRYFVYNSKSPTGNQYVLEATDLSSISDASYDFVLSANTLEHIANPLLALREWKRVLKEGGVLVLVLPEGRRIFDHRRPVTPLQHMLGDYEQNVQEDDLSHLDEILLLHDLAQDPGAGTAEMFRARCERNFENRCIHHHVFDSTTIGEAINWLGLDPVMIHTARPFHIITVARKLSPH